MIEEKSTQQQIYALSIRGPSPTLNTAAAALKGTAHRVSNRSRRTGP
jgi:hypothetical protein